ncbi:NADH dehydrogenase subunit C [Thermanaeromonas toyohensis ToBE]|uniref:NADH-quinone oxidoreductase subunit C n=1 Tax=Thermanaeromonas toyohensis ToBE TaxID=698762 RepID=A0A1W1VQ66_9FIRM|nr:NADH-quinone oxidoreductase subunit C [Thermanaeromonas toyohensis]SMB95370.1 NADH dehydrogenase subunit C [Thermanaeromonas toyohensis ToBE]
MKERPKVLLDLQGLKERFPEVEVTEGIDMTTLWVPVERLIEVMQVLKEDYGLNFLADLTGVDVPAEEAIILVYHLMAVPSARETRVKVKLPRGNPRAPSLVSLWPAAEVQEREAFDLLGIIFEGHPNLKRILCPDDFNGHPLRKDFTIGNGSGYLEREDSAGPREEGGRGDEA